MWIEFDPRAVNIEIWGTGGGEEVPTQFDNSTGWCGSAPAEAFVLRIFHTLFIFSIRQSSRDSNRYPSRYSKRSRKY